MRPDKSFGPSDPSSVLMLGSDLEEVRWDIKIFLTMKSKTSVTKDLLNEKKGSQEFPSKTSVEK